MLHRLVGQHGLADDVADPAQGDERRGEDERVAAVHPLGGRRRDAEVGDDARHRHVHDRGVDDDHGEPEGEAGETDPAVPI